jgi:hypothetical protein
VMPEVPRRSGPVISYFVPTDVAVRAVREAHADWLRTNPSTKGNNRTWNIWFGDDVQKSGGFAKKWLKFRINGACSTAETASCSNGSTVDNRTLGTVIAEARSSIAKAAGVPIAAVKITVALD